MKSCPHAEIRFCPLYVSAHDADGLGCGKGMDEEGCGVAHGVVDYGRELAAVSVAKPQMVAELAFAEVEEERKQQRARNLRINGIH